MLSWKILKFMASDIARNASFLLRQLRKAFSFWTKSGTWRNPLKKYKSAKKVEAIAYPSLPTPRPLCRSTKVLNYGIKGNKQFG